MIDVIISRVNTILSINLSQEFIRVTLYFNFTFSFQLVLQRIQEELSR